MSEEEEIARDMPPDLEGRGVDVDWDDAEDEPDEESDDDKPPAAAD